MASFIFARTLKLSLVVFAICFVYEVAAPIAVGQESANEQAEVQNAAPAETTPEPSTQVVPAKDSNAVQSETQAGSTAPTVSDWSQWRGPNRDGIIEELNWPETLSNDVLQEKWNVKLGPSYSGPIVAGNTVFVTETEDKKNEVVKAFNVETGEQLWRAEWKGSMRVPFFAASNGSWIRSTPAYSEGKLYVGGIKEVLVCLDAVTGNVVWKVDFPQQMKSPVPSFGFVCSPLIDGNDLFIQAGGAFLKMNKNTGKVIWQSLVDHDGMNSSAFSSPYIATLAGLRQIIVQTRTTLHGVDIKSGKPLWSEMIPNFRGMNIVTPTVFKNGVFTSTYQNTSQLINVSTGGGTGETFVAQQAWVSPIKSYMSSPIILGEFAYLHLQNGRFACLNMNDGEIAWRSKAFGKYASMVASGNKIMALDERGDLMLLKAIPESFEVIDSRKVSNNSWAHLAVRGDFVVVRELNGLKVFKWKK